jgi:hypothetical protein
VARILLLTLAASTLLTLPASAIQYRWEFDMFADNINNAPTPDGTTDSAATGFTRMVYDTEADHLTYVVAWIDLESDLTALHIHGPAAASESSMNHLFDIYNASTGIPAGIDRRNDLTSGLLHLLAPHPGHEGQILSPPEEVIAALVSGQAYVNVHTEQWPTGEIRGNFPAIVPEPGTGALLLAALAATTWRRRTPSSTQ